MTSLLNPTQFVSFSAPSRSSGLILFSVINQN